MIEKLRNLPYVSLREHEDLNNIEILYIDTTNENILANIFQKKIQTAEYGINKIEELPNAILELFIDKLSKLNAHTTEVDKFNTDVINKYISDEDEFIIIPSLLRYTNDNINVIETNNLTDTIYIGKKTKADMPGIILITNEEGISDVSNLRMSIVDLGFFPEKAYKVLKIK